MAELVGEAFLSASLQVALERLASRDILDYFRGRKLKEGLLEKLDIALLSINQIIEDAEERQYINPNVKRWLDKLKDAVFKAEDLLDEIATEAAQQKLDAEHRAMTCKVRNLLPTFVDSLENQIESRIKEVLDNLEVLAKYKDVLGLKKGDGAGSKVGVNRKLLKRLPTTSLIDESSMYGRDVDEEEIIQILLSDYIGGNRLQRVNVVSITGTSGIGKTTLAQLVYEDKRMKDQFQLRAWIRILEEFDVVQVTKAILESLKTPIKKTDDLNVHQDVLKERLFGKKFFLVLDDVCNGNRQSWEVLQDSFKVGAPGSKILVTTHNKNVAEVMHSTHIHLLNPLENEDCWKLFEKHAFGDQHNAIDPSLVSIGRDIVKKCGGLPLAIKTLGSQLHTKLSSLEWLELLVSDMWNLSEDESNIIPSLRLSYHYLPSNLKRCFAYCSIFPKGYKIDKDVLIQLWIAEGLLHPHQKGQSMEEVGNEVFNDLESRSFFEPSKSGGSYFIMHDLLNELAKSVMGEFYLQLEGNWSQDLPIKARYISYRATNYGRIENFEPISNCNQLRSFISLQLNQFVYGIKDHTMHDLLLRLACLKYMRVLSLNGFEKIKRLPNDICNLKHLRYLDLSHTPIEELPKSICLLINLQTLKLQNCPRLTKLPSNLHKLINLRHLKFDGTDIEKMPKHIGKLKHLQTMNEFVVGKHRGSDTKELGTLNNLRGFLIISKMENIIDPTNAREASMKDKKYLDKLELKWGGTQNIEVSESPECMLKDLQPNSNLKELIVSWYTGRSFPYWLDGPYLPNLVSLVLRSCRSCINLPPLGQLPSLEKLYISRFDGVKVIGHEFYGNGSSRVPFRSLSYLCFRGMKEWEEWNVCYEGHSWPCLQELHLWACPKLTTSLPQNLCSLKKLHIWNCKNLEASLPRASVMVLSRCEKISLKDMPAYIVTTVGISASGLDESSILLKDRPTCSLTDAGISGSEVNKSFLLPTIHSLTLEACPQLESLPQSGLLSSLQSLSIMDCPKLVASRKDWGLHDLLSLENIVVGDDFENVETFPEEGLLPANVQSLSFHKCIKLKTINYRGLLHLQSLKSLYIWNCPRLSLDGLPQDGLPKSLSIIKIWGYCPLLTLRCQKEMGQDWPKISHIPQVVIF